MLLRGRSEEGEGLRVSELRWQSRVAVHTVCVQCGRAANLRAVRPACRCVVDLMRTTSDARPPCYEGDEGGRGDGTATYRVGLLVLLHSLELS